MNKTFKKILSIILSVTVLISLFTCMMGLTASAVEATDSSSFVNAIDSANTSSTTEIKVNSNISVDTSSFSSGIKNKRIKFTGTGTVTLSHMLYFSDSCTVEFAGPSFVASSSQRLIIGYTGSSSTPVSITFTSGSFNGDIQAQQNTTININGGSFTNNIYAQHGYVIDSRASSSKVYITGGNFTKGTKTTSILKLSDASGVLSVTGGTYDQNPGNYVPNSENKMVVKDADGIYSLTAAPDGAQFASSADDLNSMTSGTVIINKDITSVAKDKMNFKSKTITYKGAGSVTFASGANGLTVNAGSNITIDGPTFIESSGSSGDRALCVYQGVCTINSGGITGEIQYQGNNSSTSLVINGGTITQISGEKMIYASDDNGSVRINGGTFVGLSGQSDQFANAGTGYGAGIDFKITGGTFNFDPSQYVASGYVARPDGSNYVVGQVTNVAQIVGGNSYESLSKAISEAPAGATIEILDEVSTGDSLGVNKNLTFTGNHTVTFTGGSGLTVTSQATVTINGPTFKQGGATRAVCIYEATVTVTSGGFEGLIDNQGDGGGNSGKAATLNINGGTFKQDSSCTTFADNIRKSWLIYNADDKSVTNITNGTFIGDGNQNMLYASMGTFTISGGTFNKADTVQKGIEKTANCTVSITGGTFNFDPSSLVASGYKATENPTGTWTVAIDDSKQAKIENTEYKTLAEAVTAARDGDTIEILDNISGAAEINTKDITAKILTFTGSFTVTFGSGSGLTANTGSHITINGPTFVQGGATRALCVYDGTVDIISGGITGWIQNQGGATSQGVLNIYDGIFTQGSSNVLLDTRVALRGETNIYGGTFVGVGASELFDIQEDTALNISGGTFTKTDSQDVFTTGDNTHASKIISGGSFNFDPTEWLAYGCKATENGGIWTVSAETSANDGILRFAGRKADGTRTTGMLSQRIALAANTTYTFSLKYREVGGAEKAITLSGVTLGNPTDDGTSYSVTFTTGTGGGTLTVSLGRADTAAGKGASVYFADVKCLASGSSENLVLNGDFKQGLKDWFVFAGSYAPKNVYMAVDTVELEDTATFFSDEALKNSVSNKAIEIECADGTTESLVKFYAYLKAGSYRFSYNYRAYGDEVLIDYSSSEGVSMTEVDDGQKFVKTYDVTVAGDGTKTFSIYFRYIPTGAKMYFSNIELYKVESGNNVGTNILADVNPVFSKYYTYANGRFEFKLPAGDDASATEIVGHGIAAQWGVTIPAAVIEIPTNFFTEYSNSEKITNLRKAIIGKEEKTINPDLDISRDGTVDILDLVRQRAVENGTIGADDEIAALKSEILGAADTSTTGFSKIIYVDSNASSNGDGTLATPYNSLATAINNASSGNAILLKRGSVFRTPSSYNSQYTVPEGVTLGSYGGTGAKPQILGSDKNYKDVSWTETSSGSNIWKVSLSSGHSPDMVGNVYLIDSEGKITIGAGIKDGAYITDTSSLTSIGDFYWVAASNKNSATLYMYCDQNPSSKYSSIEFALNKSVITLSNNVTVDNIAIFYGGQHGINGAGLTNVNVTNCEIGYIGGAVNDDGAGLGNGIQFGNGGSNLVANHNYVYQCFDAGISPQSWTDNKPFTNVKFTNNLLVENFYNIEFWTSGNAAFNGLEITGNIMHRAGYGWSWDKRITGHNLAPLSGHIYGSKSYNTSNDNSITISGNIFSEARANIISWCWGDDEGVDATAAKKLTAEGNAYYQSWGSHNGQLMLYGDVSDSEFYKGASQTALKKAVDRFEIGTPKTVIWLEQAWITK